jgi:hypothetical protein
MDVAGLRRNPSVLRFGKVTFERKIVVGLEEIRAISFECHKCKSRLTVSPDDIRDIPASCPHCNFSWRQPIDPEAGPVSPPRNFAVGIKEIRIRFGADVIGFKILLEFDEPRDHV